MSGFTAYRTEGIWVDRCSATPESLNSIALSAKALKNLEKFAWPKGAIMYCVCGCGYQREKSPEEMAVYLKGWPKMHGHPVGVKPK